MIKSSYMHNAKLELTLGGENMNNNQYIKKISEELSMLGVKESGVLLVHTSLKSLGGVTGGAETVIKGIQLAIDKDGTLLMPTLSYKDIDGDKNDTFSAKDTPSNVGALTEFFRQMEGVTRSIHPTHSVCGSGRYAKEVLKQHHLDNTPCGAHSPYKILSEIGGQILFIGCGLESNTSMHGVEELVEPDYLFDKELQYKIYNENREKSYMYCKKHGFEGVEQRYDRLEGLLEDGKTIRRGKVLGADCCLIDAKAMWKVAHEAMKQDQSYFVEANK